MARIKFYNNETGKWEYADKALSVGGSGGSGALTFQQITALDGMFKIASFTADPTDAYAAFKTAFGIVEPEATLTSISAVYSGGDVAVGTAVNDLAGIVVTAHYSDGTSKAVTDYTLSGEIAEGENTITVTYEGMTTTFTVTGVAESATWEPLTITYSTVQGTPELAGKVYSDDGQTVLSGLGRGKYLSEVFETDTMVSATIANSGITCYVGHCVYINNETYNVYNAVAVAGGKTETVEMIIPSGQQLIVVGNYTQHFTVEAKKKVVA